MLEHPVSILYQWQRRVVMLEYPAPILYQLEHPVSILYLVVKKGSNVGVSSPHSQRRIVVLEYPAPSLTSGKEG